MGWGGQSLPGIHTHTSSSVGARPAGADMKLKQRVVVLCAVLLLLGLAKIFLLDGGEGSAASRRDLRAFRRVRLLSLLHRSSPVSAQSADAVEPKVLRAEPGPPSVGDTPSPHIPSPVCSSRSDGSWPFTVPRSQTHTHASVSLGDRQPVGGPQRGVPRGDAGAGGRADGAQRGQGGAGGRGLQRHAAESPAGAGRRAESGLQTQEVGAAHVGMASRRRESPMFLPPADTAGTTWWRASPTLAMTGTTPRWQRFTWTGACDQARRSWRLLRGGFLPQWPQLGATRWCSG